MGKDSEPCKNFEFCGSMQWFHTNSYINDGGDPELCVNCAIMFRKKIRFRDDVECPICFEPKRGIILPNCEHAMCIECFRKSYYGIYKEPDFPYSKDIEEEYEGLCDTPKSFLDKYPLIYEYEKENNKRLDEQEEMQLTNSRCPLCRK
tara:strand:+ start:221 stop:664 length:444 start_codon:yes stop_codon:yes gene_type:complete